MSAGDMDNPFQPIDPQQMLDISQMQWSGGVMVMAIATDHAGVKLPGLIFRFPKADGSGFYPDIAVVTTDDQLAKLEPLISEAIAAARRAAKMGNVKKEPNE